MSVADATLNLEWPKAMWFLVHTTGYYVRKLDDLIIPGLSINPRRPAPGQLVPTIIRRQLSHRVLNDATLQNALMPD